jgi:hypothetical protein
MLMSDLEKRTQGRSNTDEVSVGDIIKLNEIIIFALYVLALETGIKANNMEPKIVVADDRIASGDSLATVTTAVNDTHVTAEGDSTENKGSNLVSDLSSGAQFVFVVKKEPAKIGWFTRAISSIDVNVC